MRKKGFKRIAAWLVGLALLAAALPLNVFAADPLPDSTKQGSITIHKYAVGDADDYTSFHDGDELTGTESVFNNATPLKDIEFTVYEVEYADQAGRDALDAAVKALKSSSDFDTDLQDILTTYGKSGGYEADGKTDENGVLRFGGSGVVASGNGHLGTMDQGIYLVVESDSDAVTKAADPFLVEIPMTNGAGKDWIYDVHVYPKNSLNSAIEIYKTVTTEVALYDTIPYDEAAMWFLQSEIPAGIDTAIFESYIITDELDERLAFESDEDDVEVYYYKDNTVASKEPLKKDIHYEVEIDTTDGKLTVELTEEGREEIAGAAKGPNHPASDAFIWPRLYVTFETVYTTDCLEDEDNIAVDIPNEAVLTYKTSVDAVASEKNSNEAFIHYGGLRIVKVNGTGALLPGAEFLIYDDLTKAQGADPADALKKPGTSTPWSVITDTDGEALFYGLAYAEDLRENTYEVKDEDAGEGSTKYWLVEITAPLVDPLNTSGARYNLLREPWEVTVDALSHLTDADGGTAPEVVNQTGFLLPSTGGMGTMLFTVGGILLIGAAAVLLVVSRRRGRAK